ncbi:Bystin-domain-containing protein [Didymella exigua CBS 183.55]|uniref:Bystin-domain-containing protein n=1 Tax=Didymella exigua CBS 183.55 TaxID=1150837 RepID=A0A6A5R942_9PLEO|nr:Bystin-domain-containing protein [Didymella exigua CBS 183.55]KAF1924083.1 Bystin-domain-containing protein [Didymella exigua CBS 183.55]
MSTLSQDQEPTRSAAGGRSERAGYPARSSRALLYEISSAADCKDMATCLLAFAQRYRNDITEDQREALLDLLLTRGHKSISPDVRRELLEGRGRGVVADPAAAVGVDGDDTMVMG